MKTKIRRLVSILSAMVLMILCAVPAFADDTLSIDYVNNYPSFAKWIRNYYLSSLNINTDDYLLMFVKPSNGRIGGVFVPRNYISSNSYTPCISQKNVTTRLYYSGTVTIYSFTFVDWNNNTSNCRVSVFSSIDTVSDNWFGKDSDFCVWDVCYSEFDIYDYDTRDIFFNSNASDPNAPPVPFTVDYSPSLKTGLVRKGTLVAPGASNDGQEVETNTIAVTVKLTDAFLNASKPISGAYTYSYQFTCFVVPSEYKDSDIKTMSEHAIYTAAQDNLHYLYYENETLDVDDSLSSEPATGPDIVPVSEQWANATGVSNCFLLERDSNNTPLRNVTIDLHNIDFEKHKSDSYNIVVLGHIVRKSEYGWTAYPSYFKSDCSSLALESTKEYPMNFGSSEQPVVNKNFYDYYSVVSADWSFKDYPKFEPHKVGGVTVGDSPLDFKRTAKGVQDYNMWEQGGTDNTLKPDDFDKYKEQKKLDENFGSVDFGLDSIKSVFDGSSDFFKFLTASIGILPTTFLTILISFFVIMLAICVVKWVLK